MAAIGLTLTEHAMAAIVQMVAANLERVIQMDAVAGVKLMINQGGARVEKAARKGRFFHKYLYAKWNATIFTNVRRRESVRTHSSSTISPGCRHL